MPKITKTTIDTIEPSAKDAWVWDSAVPGFGVRAQASGRKTYVARYRTRDGRQRKLTIGRCCDIPPDRARDMARQVFAEVAAGGDPAHKRSEARKAPTMAELHERYMREHAPYKKESSLIADRRHWVKHILPAMGTKKIDSITKADVMALHAGLGAKPVTANHARSVLSKAMNLAIDWGWRTGPNPCIGVKKFKTRQRETILTPDQMAALYRHIPAGPFGNLIKLLSLTGCRLSEIMTARRDWVDHHRRLLLLPDSKVGQRKISLPQAALDIIAAMPPNKWLIPGKSVGRHLTQPHYAWARLLRQAKLPSTIRIHDLRHSFGSLGHMAGLSQRQIADMLGHSSMKTTERYLHGYQQDAARGVDIVAAQIQGAWKAPADD